MVWYGTFNLKPVQAQYERFPFPQISIFVQPSLEQTHTLSYEYAQYLRTGHHVRHNSDTRILVAGCGSFEPLVVAKAHPKAQVVAVDFSRSNLKKLRWRILVTAILSRSWPKIKCLQADLHDSDLAGKLGHFDYIICTGVIHHSSTPEKMLQNLTALLKPHGVLRVMIYAKKSRMWIQQLKCFFREHAGQTIGSNTSGFWQEYCALIATLPKNHPLRTSFETYSDAKTLQGFVDGFFHAQDTPMTVLDLEWIAKKCGLGLLGFGHAWHSQPAAFGHGLDSAKLSPWEKLEFLDSVHELAVNPVYFLSKAAEKVEKLDLDKQEVGPLVISYPLQARAFGKVFLKAPMMPPELPHQLYALEKLPIDLKKLNKAKLERYLIGGWVFSNLGCLPPALLANRDLSTTLPSRLMFKATPIEPLEFPDFVTRHQFPDAAKQVWEDLQYAHKLLQFGGAKLEAEKLPNIHSNKLSFEHNFLKPLAEILQPRVDLDGNLLPYLSTVDFIKDFLLEA